MDRSNLRRLLIVSALLAAVLVAGAAFAGTKIDALPAGTTLAGTEPIPTVQSNTTVATTPAAINTYVKANGTQAVANGGTNLTTATDDNVMVGNGTTWQSKALTSCSTATSAVTYNTSTNAWGCNVLTIGTVSSVDLTAPSVFTVTGNPVTTSGTLAIAYSGTALPVANGGTNLTASADDNVMVGNGTTWQTKALTSCSGASSAVTYNTTTNAFGCNTITATTGDTYVTKASGTARNTTTTLTNDPDLVFTSLAAGSYSFDALFYFTNAGATANYKQGFLAGSAPTNSVIVCEVPGLSVNQQNNWLTSPIGGNVNGGGAGSYGVSCHGTVVLAGTVTLTYQWAQQTSDAANTTLNAGSYMHVHKNL